MENTYEIRFVVYTDRPLSDAEQRLLGDTASDAEDSFADCLMDIGGSSFAINAYGPKELQRA